MNANTSATAQSTALTARQAVDLLVKTANNSQYAFNQLSGLFRAIEQISEDHKTIKNLSSIGNYLSGDWVNIYDCDHNVGIDAVLEVLEAHEVLNKPELPDSPDAFELRYPPNIGPFSVWYNRSMVDEGSPDPWAVNDANGDAIFDLPSLLVAQEVARVLKLRGGTAMAMKGGVR